MERNADEERKIAVKNLIGKKNMDMAAIVTNIETQEHFVRDYIQVSLDKKYSRTTKQNFLPLCETLLKKFPGEFIRDLNTQIESAKNALQNEIKAGKSYFEYLFNDQFQDPKIAKLLEKCILQNLGDFHHQIKSICNEYFFLSKDHDTNLRQICEFEMQLYSIPGGKLSENEAKEYQRIFDTLSSSMEQETIVKFNKYLKDKTEQKSDIQVYLEKALEKQPISLSIEQLDNLQKNLPNWDWDQFITKFIQELSRLVLRNIQGVPDAIIFLIKEYGPRFILKLNNDREIFEKLLKHELHQDVLRIIKECLSEFQYTSFDSIAKDTIPYIMEIFKKEFKADFQRSKNKSLRANIYESIKNLAMLGEPDYIEYGSRRRLMCDITTLLDQIHSYEPSKDHETQYLNEKYIFFSEQLLRLLEGHKPLYDRDEFTYNEIITAEEDVNTEFKSSLLPLDKELSTENNNYYERLEEAICSMLNTEGGIIYLGIDDNTSKVTGGNLNLDRFEASLKVRLGKFDMKTIPIIGEHVKFEPIKLNTKDKLTKKHIAKIFVKPVDTTMYFLRGNCFYRGDGTTINLVNNKDREEIKNNRKITPLLYQMNAEERKKFLRPKLSELVEKNFRDNIFINYDEKSQFVIEMVKFQQEMNSKKKNVVCYQNIQKYLIQDFNLLSPKYANLEQRIALYFGEFISQESSDGKYQDLQLQHKEFIVTERELTTMLDGIEELQNSGGRIYFGINSDSKIVTGIDLSRKERDNFKSGLYSKIYQKKKIIPNNYVKIYFIPLLKFYAGEIIPGKFVIKIVVKAKVIRVGQGFAKGEIQPERIFADPIIDSKSIKDRTDLQDEPREFIKEFVKKKSPQIITA